MNKERKSILIKTGYILAVTLISLIFIFIFYTIINTPPLHKTSKYSPTPIDTIRIDIDVVIQKNNYQHWYAFAHHYTADVTVLSPEYGIEKTFHLTHDDAKRMENYRTGDLLQATICIKQNAKTGEQLDTYIDNIHP